METKPTKSKKAKPELRWAYKLIKTSRINSILEKYDTKKSAIEMKFPEEEVVRVEIREVTK